MAGLDRGGAITARDRIRDSVRARGDRAAAIDAAHAAASAAPANPTPPVARPQ